MTAKRWRSTRVFRTPPFSPPFSNTDHYCNNGHGNDSNCHNSKNSHFHNREESSDSNTAGNDHNHYAAGDDDRHGRPYIQQYRYIPKKTKRDMVELDAVEVDDGKLHFAYGDLQRWVMWRPIFINIVESIIIFTVWMRLGVYPLLVF